MEIQVLHILPFCISLVFLLPLPTHVVLLKICVFFVMLCHISSQRKCNVNPSYWSTSWNHINYKSFCYVKKRASPDTNFSVRKKGKAIFCTHSHIVNFIPIFLVMCPCLRGSLSFEFCSLIHIYWTDWTEQ